MFVTNILEDLNHQYKIVFDEKGNVKACGRKACSQLIELCEIATNGQMDFGNKETGMMNVELIKLTVKSLCKE